MVPGEPRQRQQLGQERTKKALRNKRDRHGLSREAGWWEQAPEASPPTPTRPYVCLRLDGVPAQTKSTWVFFVIILI